MLDQMSMVDMAQTGMLLKGFGGQGKQQGHQVNFAQEMGGNAGRRVVDEMGQYMERRFKSMKDSMFSINPITRMKASADQVRAIAELPFLLKRFGEGLKDANQHLAPFSGILAEAYLESQGRDFQRKIGQAERRAGSTGDMMEALDDLKDTIAPYQDAFMNSLNRLLEVGLETADKAIKIIEFLTLWDETVDLLNSWLGKSDKNNNDLLFQLMGEFAPDAKAKAMLNRPMDPKRGNVLGGAASVGGAIGGAIISEIRRRLGL